MEFTRQPISPVFPRQEVSFTFKLEGWEDKPETYEFRIIDSAGKAVGFADRAGSSGGTLTHRMTKNTVFQPTARFPGPGDYRVETSIAGTNNWFDLDRITVDPPEDAPEVKISLQATARPNSNQADLWQFIRDVSRNLRFSGFARFTKENPTELRTAAAYGSTSYDALHELSEMFVTGGALGFKNRKPTSSSPGWGPGKNAAKALPLSYVRRQRKAPYKAFYPKSISDGTFPLGEVPFVELIYVYWMEEAMLFQTLNHVIARFQNRRSPGGTDPLARLAVNPLMPLRGILWGLAEAEKDRLSLRRRAVEYEYQYGLQLIGRAVPPTDLLVERRTQFLEAFHSLLNACRRYYRELDDKTVDADAFPLLSHLQELHLVLARGANNQFADIAVIARIETLDVQWMLAQPEMHQFLGGPTMVPYEEKWMDRVDTMKTIQGWSEASVTHFYDLAVHGEQLLLSVRHGRWNDSNMEGDDAKNWAMTWRPSVQRYIHAYRAVTGVDLSERVDTTMPSTLLQRRLARKLVRY
ncbi:hypothetical protein QE394_002845 [Arthrobacter sp. SORGH_AS 212]|uniref:hypothetical protein n=1 Tax=Pseudarthrobacter sp. SORGH_AS 212 TaxID=3041777 RepID=UPI002789D889|nr:hypothetical protein [Arthrobacter sp. SORGH_AS_0212]